MPHAFPGAPRTVTGSLHSRDTDADPYWVNPERGRAARSL